MKFLFLSVLLPSFFCVSNAAAVSNSEAIVDADEAGSRTLEAVVVRADQSVPPIWKFSRGNKVIWVLGTFQPLPKGTKFNPSQIERRIAESEVVLGPQGLVVGDNIGIMKGLMLWPSIRRKKFNADGKQLKDVLPPATYSKWLLLKSKYLGGDRDVERLRPMYAANELFRAALKEANLDTENLVSPVVDNASKANNVPMVDSRLRLAVRDPKDAAKEFGVSTADDIRCLEQTMDRLDGYLHAGSALANSWAVGDLSQLSSESGAKASMSTCWARLTNEAIGRQQGVPDLYKQVNTKWIASLRNLLQKYDVLFTTLPVRDLLDSKGSVAAIRSEGFKMESPAMVEPTESNQ